MRRALECRVGRVTPRFRVLRRGNDNVDVITPVTFEGKRQLAELWRRVYEGEVNGFAFVTVTPDRSTGTCFHLGHQASRHALIGGLEVVKGRLLEAIDAD